MWDEWPLLTLIAFSPLLGILALLFTPKDNGKWIKRIGIAATLIPLALSVVLFAEFDRSASGMQFVEKATWIEIDLNRETDALSQYSSYSYRFQYHLGVDGVSMPLVFLTALISTMAALASVHIRKRWKTYFILFLLLEIGMFGVFMARDLFLFFLFFELALVPAFFIIAIWGYKDREKAANKFLVYNGVGSAIMAIAFLILINTAGFTTPGMADNGNDLYYSGDLEVIAANLNNPDAIVNQDPGERGLNPYYVSDAMKTALFLLLLVGFGIKLPIFPFHTWMLRVHAEAPPPLVMIHSGILLKMGAYGLLRFGVFLFPEQAERWALLLAILGVINILYGAVIAFVQKEFKLILAYSSISHMGIVLIGLAALNEAGVKGAVFQLVSPGLISALFFLIVGSLHERTGTTDIRELGGLAKSMPFMCGVLIVAGLASLGLPGLSGFVGELMAFLGLFDVLPAVTIVGALGIILAAVYVLRGVMRIMHGPLPERFQGVKDARLIEAIPMIALVAFIVLLGVYPAVLGGTLEPAIQDFMLRIGG